MLISILKDHYHIRGLVINALSGTNLGFVLLLCMIMLVYAKPSSQKPPVSLRIVFTDRVTQW